MPAAARPHVRRHTRVITAVLQALQALHQDGNDIAGGNSANNATHKPYSKNDVADRMLNGKKFVANFLAILSIAFINALT